MAQTCHTTCSSCSTPGRVNLNCSMLSLFEDVMCIPDLSDSTHSIHIFSDATEKAYGSITYIIHYITPDPFSCNASVLQIGATSLTLTADNHKQGELYHFRKVQKEWSFCPPVIASTNTTYLYFCVWPRNSADWSCTWWKGVGRGRFQIPSCWGKLSYI